MEARHDCPPCILAEADTSLAARADRFPANPKSPERQHNAHALISAFFMTVCVTNSDCAGRQICGLSGVCSCDVLFGRQGKDCLTFTPKSVWSIACFALGLMLSLVLLAWAAFLFGKALYQGRKGYFLSTSFACFFASVFDLILQLNSFVRAIQPTYMSGSTSWLLFSTSTASAIATLLLIGSFNLCLMWIEFFIASRRLLPISRNLRFTGSFLVWYMLVYVISAIIGVVLGSTVHKLAYLVWVVSTYISMLLLICLFTIGSARMKRVLLREAKRVKNVSMEMAENSQTGEHRQFSRCLRARAQNIVLSAGRIRVACVCFMLSFFGYQSAQYLQQVPVEFTSIARACTHVSVCGIAWSVMKCLSKSMKIDEARLAQTFTMSTSGERSFRQSQSAEARRNRSIIELADNENTQAEEEASSRHQEHPVEVEATSSTQTSTSAADRTCSERSSDDARNAGSRRWRQECARAPPGLIA